MERSDFELWKAREVARLLKLVESERRYYQEMVTALPVPLAVLAEDRSIVSVNRAFRKAFGLENQTLSGKSIDQILPSERLVEKIRDAHLLSIPQPQFSMEVNGRPLRVSISPIRGQDEESAVETLLLVEDEAAELRVDRDRIQVRSYAPGRFPLSPLAADLPVAIWQADAATLEFTAVSGNVEALLGYPASHWTGNPRFFAERIHPEDRVAVLTLYHTAIERGGDASAEYRSITASGSMVWRRETIRMATPIARGIINGVISDISRRKQLEEQLLRAERTQALHGMASRMAHDLNNPLMIITGYAEEVRDGLTESDPMRADVDQILAATERISGVTRRLLEFTRGQAEDPHPVDVAELVEGMEAKIAAAAGEGVTVELQVGNWAWAWAEPGQIEEVILAIASATREDASSHSRLIITCTSEILSEDIPQATLRPGIYTCVVIHRDGPALDYKTRAGIFESFLAKDAERTSGQTLARAYGIVREWGGDIALSSDPSQGSTLTIYLPHYQPESRASGASAKPEARRTREPLPKPDAEANRQTILIVDDEAGIRALMRKILRRERYVVLEAGSTEEALSVASKHAGPIDLLLTDVMLPGLTGRELAERMLLARPKLKVVYVSGYTDDETVRRGAIPPGSKFLQKPFTLAALVGLVRAALAG